MTVRMGWRRGRRAMGREVMRWVALCGLAGALALAAGCSRGGSGTAASMPATPPAGAADSGGQPASGMPAPGAAAQTEMGRAAAEALHKPLDAARGVEAAQMGQADATRRQLDEATR